MDEEYLAWEWWEGLDAGRRVNIFKWVARGDHTKIPQIPGQLPLIEEIKEEEGEVGA